MIRQAMTRLTENEKAAWYLGWEPRLCDASGSYIHYAQTPPDVGDPRAYMRAFESVAARGFFVEMSMYLGSAGLYTRFTIRRSAKADDDPSSNILAESGDAIAGRAAIRVLAELYDKTERSE